MAGPSATSAAAGPPGAEPGATHGLRQVLALVAVSDDMLEPMGRLRLSKVVGSPLVDTDGHPVGRVHDLVARFADDGYPPVTGVLALVQETEQFLPAHHVADLREGSVRLAVPAERLSPFERRPGEALLWRDVRGRQLIYLGEQHRGRLVRAGDILLAPDDPGWQVVAAEIGAAHRWPWQRHRLAVVVDWAHLEPFLGHVPTSRLRLRFRRLGQLHPSEVADLVEVASPEEAAEIIQAVGEDRDFEADVFEELDEEHQLELVGKRSDADVAALLGKMAPDDAADLLAEIDRDRREPILALMADDASLRLRNLLRYNPNTAGGFMSPGALCSAADDTVGAALACFRDDEGLPDTVDTVLLVDEAGVLQGAARVRELLRADPAQAFGSVAHHDPPRVHTSADLVDVTLRMTDYNLTTLPVVDDADRVVGVVTIDDVVERLVPENWRRRAEAAAD